MAEFASREETQRALTILLDLQSTDPNRLDGILNKYANPFTTWPLEMEPTRAFLRFFETPAPTGEAGGIQRNVNPRLDEMVAEFDREFAAAKEQRVTAATASKKFVSAFLERARKLNVVLPEAHAPSAGPESAAVLPDRLQNIISAAVQHPGPPEEKLLVFHALTSFASERPDKNIEALVPRAVEVARVTEALSAPRSTLSSGTSFSAIATNNFQKGVAGILDVVVPLSEKEAVVDKILLGRLAAVVSHPEQLSRGFMEKAMNRWGENFVNSSWFTRFRDDANRMIAEQTGGFKIKNGLISFASDLATTIFRAPPDENFLAYMETHRLLGARGVSVGNMFFYRNALVGLGGRVVHVERKRAPLGFFGEGRMRVGAGGAGILSGGIIGGLFHTNQGVFTSMLNRTFGSLVGFLGRLRNVKTKINGWLIAGAAVFLFILFILPIFGQSMIDTSITTGLGGEGNNEPVPPPNFGPINGSITDCITSHGTTIEGAQTLTLSADRASRFQNISQKYPQLGCYSQALNCPTTKINVTAFAAQSGGLGGYAPHGAPGNIIFYPAFFSYNDYYFAYLIAHEMMHEVEWLHSNIYDAFMRGTTDGSFQKGYCGPLGTYKAGNENSYETMSEAAAFYLVGNPILQQRCLPAYNFMKTLFRACQK